MGQLSQHVWGEMEEPLWKIEPRTLGALGVLNSCWFYCSGGLAEGFWSH